MSKLGLLVRTETKEQLKAQMDGRMKAGASLISWHHLLADEL